MHVRLPALLLALSFSGCATSTDTAVSSHPRLVVSAGPYDRRESLVTFSVAPELSEFTGLVDDEGLVVALQVQDGTAAFILPRLDAGRTRQYNFLWREDAPPLVHTEKSGSRLNFSVKGSPVVSYQAEPGAFPRPFVRNIFRRGGYLHPVYTPSGKIVTDDYATNHWHHHGIWMAWTKTEWQGRAPDFWNMGDAKGKVEFLALDRTWEGPVHGGLVARHRFVDTTTNASHTVLHETWQVTVYRTEPKGEFARYHIFDLVSTQTCAGDSWLRLPQYHYGGLGFRGHESWNGKDGTQFLTSEGVRDRIRGNMSTARWCDISGDVEGNRVGIAILDHPANFRAPQPVRLHPTEPFFCYAPQQAGDMEIIPGRPYISRYRFIVHDGAPDPGELERLWKDFAEPPTVAVVH